MFNSQSLLAVFNIENLNQAIVLVLNLGLLSLVAILVLLSFMRFKESRVYLKNQRELTRGLDTGKKLLELQKQKDEFSSIATHELNTPLAVLSGNLSMLKEMLEKKNDTANAELANKSLIGANRMISVVSALLNSSRAKTEAKNECVDPWPILKEIATKFKDTTKSKINLNSPIKIPPALIKVQPEDFREIFERLIDNAIKYGQEKPIEINIVEEKSAVKISVKDLGVGIPKDKLNMVFEKFYQGDSTWTRKAQGVGLGLYIAKKLADSNNAELSVDSEINKGSTFSVMFQKASA